MKEDIKELKENGVKTHNLAAKSYNLQCGSGSGRSFEPVLFLDGKEPSEDLPCLANLAAIRRLSPEQSAAYYKGYHQHQGDLPPPDERIEAIRVFVGGSVE